ncbi:MAG: CYTH domain-containing protein [Planctomycetota bacterium]
MREIEIKLRLPSAEAAQAVQAKLPAARAVRHQVNHYYDTADLAIQRELRGMLRVRRQDARWIVCLKLGASISDDGTLRTEEIESDWQPPRAWRPEQIGELLACGLAPIERLAAVLRRVDLVYLGALENTRSEHSFEGHLIELDRTLLPRGRVEHELECETEDPDSLRPKLLDLLRRAGVEAAPQTRTKYQRFLESLVDKS